MRAKMLVAFLLLVTGGCSSSEPPPAAQKSQQVSPPPGPEWHDGKLAFHGKSWTGAGQSIVSVGSLGGWSLTCDEPNLQLLDLYGSGQEPIARMLAMQVQIDDSWLDHGPTHIWYFDGSRSELEFEKGELHGTQREWWPNGQLRKRELYEHAMRQGLSEGWYENGQKQWDAQYVKDQEVSRNSWKEDGTPDLLSLPSETNVNGSDSPVEAPPVESD